MTKKHFKELAEILAKHYSRMKDNSDEHLFNDIASFCASQNQYFNLNKIFFNLEISDEIFMSRNIEIQLLQIIFLLSLLFNIPAPGEIT